MKKNNDLALFAFYGIYFFALGVASFTSKYLGELGLTDSQIGLIASLPAAICLAAQPIFGIISDRIRYKRNLLVVTCVVAGAFYLCLNFAVSFIPILILLTIINVSVSPVTAISSSIALENAELGGKPFGTIRLGGTIGYQVGVLAIGFILSTSLHGMYAIMGVLVFLSGIICLFFPAVKGHQHGKQKISYISIFKNKKASFLLAIIFLASLGSAFYRSFFTKYLGDIGIENNIIGIITVTSICLEIPFLFFSKKLYKKLSIWQWVLIGLATNGFRLIGLGLSSSAIAILICNIPCVTVMACFEFFPAVYLNENVDDGLKGSSQSALALVNFSIAQILGSFFGGLASDAFGISKVFVGLGILMFIIFTVAFVPCLKMSKKETYVNS